MRSAVDAQPGDRAAQLVKRAAATGRPGLGEGLPLRLPAAEAALLLLRHGAEHRGRRARARGPPRPGRRRRPPGSACGAWWTIRRARPPPGSDSSATSVCASRARGPARSFPGCPCRSPTRWRPRPAGRGGRARAGRAAASARSSRQRLRHVEASLAERGQRSHRAAELQDQRAAPQRVPGARDARSTASSHPAAFRPKVVGSACCIQVRARPWRGAVRPAPGGPARRRAVASSAFEPLQGLAQLQHEAGVDRILAGRAPVDEAARPRHRPRPTWARELLHERDGEVAGPGAAARASAASVEALRRHCAAMAGAAAGGMTPVPPRRARAPPRSPACPAGARGRRAISSRTSQRNNGSSRRRSGPLACQQSKKTVSPRP